MSDFTEVAILVALFIAGIYVYILMERLAQERYDATETGVIGGVPMSAKYRRFYLTVRVMPATAAVVINVAFLAMGWWLLAEAVDSENARRLAYLGTFLASVVAFAWLIVAPFLYAHLASRVREAEQG